MDIINSRITHRSGGFARYSSSDRRAPDNEHLKHFGRVQDASAFAIRS